MIKPKKQLNKKRNRLLSLYEIVAFLLILTVGSFLFVVSPYAKYATQAGGTDGARVARFFIRAVDGTDGKNIALDENTLTAHYSFTVTNFDADNNITNETTTSYDVVVTFPDAVSGLTVSVTNDENTVLAAVNTEKTVFTMANVGAFVAGVGTTHNLTLNFALDYDNAEAGEWTSIEIKITATQQNG